MNALRNGVDLVELERVERMLAEHPQRFALRCFTPAERDYAEAGGALRVARYAARFAAKEAAMKALGTGLGEGVSWLDIEVGRQPSGAVHLRFTGRFEELARQQQLNNWSLSLSHSRNFAVAMVVAQT